MNLDRLVSEQSRVANLIAGGGAPGSSAGAQSGMPWIDPPDNYAGFDPVDVIATPAIGSPDTEVMRFVVPIGWDGVIRGLLHRYEGGGFIAGGLVWRLLVNGAAVRNYDSMQVEFGTTGNAARPLAAGIRIYSGQVISYVVNAAGGGGWVPSQATQVICGISGYIYPRSSV